MATSNIRPGLLIIGRKRPGFDLDWAKQIEAEALATLEALKIGAVTRVRAVDDPSLREALRTLRYSDAQVLVVVQPTIGDGRLAPLIGQLWNQPVIIWATPERPDADKVTACGLVGAHLFASILRQQQRQFEIVYGPPKVPETIKALTDAVRIVHTAGFLRQAKAGLVGQHVPGFINLHVDPARLSRELGVQLQHFSLPEYLDRVRSIDPERLKANSSELEALQDFPNEGIGRAELELDERQLLAVSDLMSENSLDALAVRCWPELPDVLGQWPYLAIARLTSAHKAVALEGDVDGALCGLISELLGMGPAFITDWLAHSEHAITIWHPGMAPVQLCEPFGAPGGPRLTRHFNNGKPLCVDAQLKADMDVTLFRLWSCDGRYQLTACNAHTKRLTQPLAGNSALICIGDRSVPRWFDDLCHAGMPHHLSIAAGHHADTLRRLARLLGIGFVS
jgi:L-fucose isomerase-like protein